MYRPETNAIHLKDYTPSAYLIDTIELDVAVLDDFTRVTSRLTVRRNSQAIQPTELALDGEKLELESVSLDGHLLDASDYTLDAEHLTVKHVPEQFVLETVCRIRPRDNSALMGFYASKDGFFTQCEAEGFRRITFFIDRPDVMARYVTTLHADKALSVLLANGNLVASGEEPPTQAGGAPRHWARWEDPFAKPSYLFAMVAAKLAVLEDSFKTRSGRDVRLALYAEPGQLDQSAFAMQALKKAMQWDEAVFGLEFDLDQYIIVAVSDFNQGAMENKGLNIFNTKYVLARPDTATDLDFQNIARVVAHEYFHNWTGNRVTCRDWFQLSLKEGLTVFRDQEFCADLYSRPVQRIRVVRNLRARQFTEDASPMAHPVRPQSYVKINNFYTATVYAKGAEVVRMIHTLLGAQNFRKGMDLYFQRHDGQAVTTEDFVRAMADASGVNLDQFSRWYSQPGTPVVDVTDAYDPATQRYILNVRQSNTNPLAPAGEPLHIPFAVGLLNAAGNDLPLQLEGEGTASQGTRVLSLTQAEHRFVFEAVPEKPVPSLARGFSAPIIVKYPYDESSLARLMAHDSDPFNRWEAGQRLATALILKNIEHRRAGRDYAVPDSFIAGFASVLADADEDPEFAAEALLLPTEDYIAEQMQVVDPDAIYAVRTHLARTLAEQLYERLLATYHANTAAGVYSLDGAAAGKRALRNRCLAYLVRTQTPEALTLAEEQFNAADNMTDALAALHSLIECDCPQRERALQAFYARWSAEPLVVDKWLLVQAVSSLPRTLDEVKRLTTHAAFSIRNPNKVFALIGGFAMGNHVRFHAADGSGYAFLADQILALDEVNPQVAARMARAFDRWKKFDAPRQVHARAALERIRGAQGLSKDVAEIVTRALQ
jgi:aminopeptidase N